METTVTAEHDWQVERIRGRKRACAMPASLRRTCRRCGLMEVRSGLEIGADWAPLNRPLRPCGGPAAAQGT
jgi:hypothetical protein